MQAAGVGFQLISPFGLRGDQPQALARLEEWYSGGHRFATLLGVTGSGKTFTMANLVARLQRPVLVITHNKTLAAQLYSEFLDFFPNNAIAYFVSYYDYYQPEAYIPGRDLYIEKDSAINEEIDRFRHAATASIFSRRDVLVVASVSCIYGLGSPEDYLEMHIVLEEGKALPRQDLIARLTEIQYSRNDMDFSRSRFRVRGETIDILPASSEDALRVRFFGDEIERIERFDPLTGEILARPGRVDIFPAQHFVTPVEKKERAMAAIEAELQVRLAELKAKNKLVEAQRLYERTRFDLEMIRETGFCKGIENYSRHLSGRQPGEPPDTLIDYLPKDCLIIIDESHMTLPQLRGMQHGDKSRKETLVDYGFRLPSALDNRPLTFDEFLSHPNPILFVSATPAAWELEQSQGRVAEQLIRPTGLLDPEIEVRPTEGQMDRLLADIQERTALNERVLVTTLTKRMAQDLATWLEEMGVRSRYLHADIETLERVRILRELRLGEFDVLVGINLLREGLDLPEVSLVSILDADKEGFLRSAWALMQTSGRAARNAHGRVVLYGDKITPSMQYCITETTRRRALQHAFNVEHGIVPTTIVRAVPKMLSMYPTGDEKLTGAGGSADKAAAEEAKALVVTLRTEMEKAAGDLKFERAAQIRDEIIALEEAYFESALESKLHQALKKGRDQGLTKRPRRGSHAPAPGQHSGRGRSR